MKVKSCIGRRPILGLGFCKDLVGVGLFIHLSSMPDSNYGNDKPSVIDLIDDAVVADADAPGVAASELLTARWTGILLEFQ